MKPIHQSLRRDIVWAVAHRIGSCLPNPPPMFEMQAHEVPLLDRERVCDGVSIAAYTKHLRLVRAYRNA